MPSLAAVSAGCGDVDEPAVRFLIGTDGKTYYIELDRSTGCESADHEVVRWVRCWTYQPATCGSERVPYESTSDVTWSVSSDAHPSCTRDHEVDEDPVDEGP